MARRNYPKHPRKSILTDRYDLDYINLPEYPNYCKIIVRPLKTIYVNLDADFDSDDFYVVRGFNDPIMRKIESRMGGAT